MKIYKGCNQEVTVQIAPCCIDVEGIDNLVLNFYTIGDTSIEFSGDSITRDGKNATVVFQPAQLELLPDGIIRYVSTFDMDEEEKVYDMSTTYYLKTPANYETQHFVTEENMMDYIEGSEELKDYIDDQVSEGIEPVEEAMSGLTQNLENLSGSVEDLSASTVSGLTELDDKFSGYVLTSTYEEYTGDTANLINTKISKPTTAGGRGSSVQPIYIANGSTTVCRVSTAASSRWNALVGTDNAGMTHAGRLIVFHQSGQEAVATHQIGKIPTIDGFTTLIIPTGDETNELTNEHQRYLVDSRDYMKLVNISIEDFLEGKLNGTLDDKALYLIENDEFRTKRLMQVPDAYGEAVDESLAVEGTIKYVPVIPEHIELYGGITDGTYPETQGEDFTFNMIVDPSEFDPTGTYEQFIYYTNPNEDIELVIDRYIEQGVPFDAFNCYFADYEGNLIQSGFTGNFSDGMDAEATYNVSFTHNDVQFTYELHYKPLMEYGSKVIEITDKSGEQKEYEFFRDAGEEAVLVERQDAAYYRMDENRNWQPLIPDVSSITETVSGLVETTQDLDGRVVDLENEMLEKQDELTPGSGISIENGVISCTLSPESGISSGVVQTMIDTAIEAETSRTESTYAKSTDLDNYSTTADTAGAISSALTDYSTTADTQSAITSALTGYATESWVQQQGYITGATGINDAGNNYTPVYVSGGTVIAADTSYPGRRWGVPMFVNPSDGGVEGGAFLDFHNSANTYSDYSGRIRKRAETAGFSFVYDVSGQETNPLASNEYYSVDSKNIIHIVKLTQQQYNDIIPDNYTLYIIV